MHLAAAMAAFGYSHERVDVKKQVLRSPEADRCASQNDLADAFAQFNHAAEHLVEAYRTLERRSEQLHRELAAARDERMKQLTEKERLADRLQRLLAELPAGVLVIDAQGTVREANASAMRIFDGDLLGLPWREVLKKQSAGMAGGGNELRLKNGKRINVVQKRLGSEPGSMVFVYDVTEIRRMEETLHRHERLSAMGEMAATLAHQIRTPLSAALLYLTQMQIKELPAGERRRFLDNSVARLRHLERLINDMLAFARGPQAANDRVDVRRMLAIVQADSAKTLLDSGAALNIHCSSQVRWLRGSLTTLAGIFNNLIQNAVQAGAKTVDIDIQPLERHAVRICVADDGRGIPQQYLDHVFDPFFTLRRGGTGLGLAVVRATVEAHKGRVVVSSRPGEGTVFTLCLPTGDATTLLASGLFDASSPAMTGAGAQTRPAAEDEVCGISE